MISPPADADRANYLNQMEQVRLKFNELDMLTTRLQQLSDTLESSTTGAEFKKIHYTFREEMQKANQLIKVIKSQIDALDVSNTDFQAKYSEGRESDVEFRRVSWAGFSNRLRSSLINFNKSQSRFETVYAKRTGERGFNPDLTQSADASPAAARGAMATAFAQAAAEEDSIKREDMKRLERSLREIHEAFLQIAALVDSQGEMLDCIEFSIVNAKNYAHQANVQLIKARKKQRQRTWLYFCCWFVGILIIVGIALGIWQLVKSLTS